MRKYLLLPFFILFVTSLFAQSTEGINYQAVIRNASNILVTNTSIGVQVAILKGSAQGTASYIETHTITTNSNGLMNLTIGLGAASQGTYEDINWSEKPYFVSISLDLNGGTAYTHFSTSELHSVPYSLHANKADSLTNPLTEGDGITIADNTVKLSAGTADNQVKVWDNTQASWINKSISVSTGVVGQSSPIRIRDPYLGMNYQIATQGAYPVRNSELPHLGEIMLFAGDFAVYGYALCNGQILPINQNAALFSLLGTKYGGNGQTTFALPDLRGRSVVHMGTGNGLTPIMIGETGGSETIQILSSQMPAHNHPVTVTFTAP